MTAKPADKPSSWTCATCGTVFRSWAAAERHATTTRHYRIETDLR